MARSLSDAIRCPECGFPIAHLNATLAADLEQAERELRRLRRIIKARENADANKLEQSRRMPDARKVWEHWLSVFHANDAGRYKFGDKRKEVILKALGTYTVEELCEAVTGAQFSKWNMEKGVTDVTHLLVDDRAIDAHRGRYAKAREAGVV